ncbi:CLUMA_CG010860, isoform A [Clunio marinus]|uniref:CLUMA_CG010860, isoform A n=1 Tax=Clunio marinus TaxID=568069 RepID=A0A1J1IB06_9DIPT|nr:CLUMA_CG010860, isoform A [Clunio marinus]
MSFDKLQNLPIDIAKEQCLCVSTTNGKYFGKFNKISCNGKRLQINEVTNDRNEVVGKFKCFNESDVKSVKFINHRPFNVCDEDEKKTNGLDLKFNCRFTSQKNDHILMLSKNPIFVSQADQTYFQALSNISQQFICGMSTLGTNKGRIYNINLLTIATSEKIFIFDMISLNASNAMKEFRKIFEDESIMKIVFNSAMLKDNLKIKHNVELNGFFDISFPIAEFYSSQYKFLDLNQSIETILGINPQIRNQEVFLKRPINQDNLIDIALTSAYLLPMYSFLSRKTFSKYFEKKIEAIKPHPSIEHLMKQLIF